MPFYSVFRQRKILANTIKPFTVKGFIVFSLAY